MSGIINVSDEKLDKIYEYVQDFQDKILVACDELSGACETLKRSNSEEDISEVDEVIEKIRAIIESEQPTFEQLKTTIAAYSAKVKKMKSILRR